MKFHYIKILVCLNFLSILVTSMQSNTKKYTSEAFDPNYAHFAESLYNPNYKPQESTDNSDNSINYMDLINVFKPENVNSYTHPQLLQKIVPQTTTGFSEQNNRLPLLRAILLKQKQDQLKANYKNANANTNLIKKVTINPKPNRPLNVAPIQFPKVQEKKNNLKKQPVLNQEENLLDDSSLDSDLSSIDI